jgi:hypothetical protein
MPKLAYFAACMLLLAACQPKTTEKPSAKADGSAASKHEYLLAYTDANSDKCGFVSPKGDTVIRAKYQYCMSDTLKNFAVVVNEDNKLVAIDANDKPLYEVFMFDNGADSPADGLFRIIKNNKIGYADAETGKIVIEPQFDCAYPFEGGKAQVSNSCSIKKMDEYTMWESEKWEYVDKSGKKVAK